MKFEDLNLPDTPETRLGFKKAEMETMLVQRSNPHLTDDGLSPGSLRLLTRAAQILLETVPTASPEQLAGAMVFLTYGFGQPVLMQRSVGQELPQVTAWSQEWRDVQRGKTPLGQASLELRQIIMSVNTALLEGYNANFQSLDVWGVQQVLQEKDRMAYNVGDIKAPDLVAKNILVRADLGQLIGNNTKPAGTGGIKPPRP